jgi:hypothetical protein
MQCVDMMWLGCHRFTSGATAARHGSTMHLGARYPPLATDGRKVGVVDGRMGAGRMAC